MLISRRKHKVVLYLLAGVLLAVPTPLDCRRQAFTCHNIPWQRPLRAEMAVQSATGLLLSTAVFVAMGRSRSCVGCASSKRARPICAMLDTDATCLRRSGAAFLLAHCPVATAVLKAPPSGFDGTGALVERAGPIGAVFTATPASFSKGAAAFHRARHRLAVVFLALPSHRDGVGNARLRCAVSIGAVLDADKFAKDLRGLAVWIGAGQLYRMLAAQAAFLHSGGGAAFSKTHA